MSRQPRTRDAGAILPLVLVVSVILGLVVVAVATYTSTTLRYGQTSENRADRFAAAQGAMDDAIEKLEIGRTDCTTGAGAGGVVLPFPELINGATSSVTCNYISGEASSLDGWALVLTGEGNPDYELVVQSGGGADKYFGGRVYINADITPPTVSGLDLKVPLEIRGGDLWYPDASCTSPTFTGLNPSGNLSFSDGFGTMCTDLAWNEMFLAPIVPTSWATPASTAPAPDAYGCTVFTEGRYTVAPTLGANNYFRSGDYLFDNVGTIMVKQQAVHFGNIDGVEGFPSIENDPCDNARQSDSTDGAAVYVSGSTRFDIDSHGGVEFSRRRHDQPFPDGSTKHVNVSLQVIPGPGGPTWNDPVLWTDSGNQKELAVQGLVWAPFAGFQFSNVTNDTTAVLRGGAVVAKLDAGASASATGFLIEVGKGEGESQLRLTSTATKNGVSLSVRAVLQYRPSTLEVAIKSWRVCDAAC